MKEARGPAGPSIWPATLALGVLLACTGVLTHPLVLASGALVAAFALWAWVRQALDEQN